ncbi:cAMP phosphodiesterase class-II:metallo-beta-lactamase superfamily protein [Campylobacterota bacterium]|nr:cAMP phosphodiesterase class-II:metallo-beta-lactamase superfamily protein [Campylobacterota bacterium]
MNSIKVFGAYSTRGNNREPATFLIAPSILVDAGNILRSLDEKIDKINHIFLTNCHAERFADIPFFIDTYFISRRTSLYIYGLRHTIENLKANMFNDEIWPDFSKIPLIGGAPSIVFKEIEPNVEICVDNVTLKPILTSHNLPTVGYVIQKGGKAIYIVGDTYKCPEIWDEINKNTAISAAVIGCTYPSEMSEFARMHTCLTPAILRDELKQLRRHNLDFYISHISPAMESSVAYELRSNFLTANMMILYDGYTIELP